MVEREIMLPVPAAAVWTALTEADALEQWFGGRVAIDPRPGGAVSVSGARERRGIVEVADEPRRLAFTWWPAGSGGDEATTVLIELVEAGGSTAVRVTEGHDVSLRAA
jgi:uncharacterized protein YndB with AHSA1/START domain